MRSQRFQRGDDRRRGGPPWPAGQERRKASRRNLPLSKLILLFRGIDDDLIAAALAECQVLHAERETVLLRPGQVNDRMYILLAGEMDIDIGDGDASHKMTFHPGQSVGEMSIADGTPASAQVTAKPGSRILVVDEGTFWNKLLTLPGVARNLFTIQAERLRRNNDTLVEKVRKEMQFDQLKRELAVAAEIQLGMLPKNFPLYPDLPQFDLFATMIPAKEVGGDFYDAFLVGHDRLFFIIGDVSGKGVAAALFMARAMTLFRTEASRHATPAGVMRKVNDELAQNNDRCMFVSVLCGVLDFSTGEVLYANGGHNPPLLGRAGRFAFIEVHRGQLVGVMEDTEFETGRLRLAAGETLLLYTDGVTEAVDRTGEQFGTGRLAAMSTAGDARTMVKALCARLQAFTEGEPQFDDITVLALTYRGS